jgi:hypothetical protein
VFIWKEQCWIGMNNAQLVMIMILHVHVPYFTLLSLLLAHFHCHILQCNIVQCNILLKISKNQQNQCLVPFHWF